MSSVFEAGINLVCIVILHNWFKEEVLGTVTALWFVADILQAIIQNIVFNTYGLLEDNNKDKSIQVLKIESYIMFGFYIIMSGICWFFFYHHPSHIGIKIRNSKNNSNAFGFVVDNTHTFWSQRSNFRNTNIGRDTSQ